MLRNDVGAGTRPEGAAGGPVECADDQAQHDRLNCPVEGLFFSVRVARCLAEMSITTLRQLVDCSAVQLLAHRTFGRQSLQEVRAALADHGLRLSGEEELTYLASPYSDPDPGVRENRYRAACAVAAVMTARGDLVYSPVAHGHGIALSGRLPVSWEYWGRLDRRMLSACDSLTVACVAGWRESRGVQAEIAVARGIGLPVRFVDPCGNAIDAPV